MTYLEAKRMGVAIESTYQAHLQQVQEDNQAKMNGKVVIPSAQYEARKR